MLLTISACSETLPSAPASQPTPSQPVTPIAPPEYLGLGSRATVNRTIDALAGRPLTALDFGLFRLNTELAPKILKALEGSKVFEVIDPLKSKTLRDRSAVSFNSTSARESPALWGTLADTPARTIEINIFIEWSASHADVPDMALRRIRGHSKQAVAVVRSFFGAPCNPYDGIGHFESDDKKTNRSCGDNGLSEYFDLPTSQRTLDPDSVLRAKANLLRTVYVAITTAGSTRNGFFAITCVGLLVSDESKCDEK